MTDTNPNADRLFARVSRMAGGVGLLLPLLCAPGVRAQTLFEVGAYTLSDTASRALLAQTPRATASLPSERLGGGITLPLGPPAESPRDLVVANDKTGARIVLSGIPGTRDSLRLTPLLLAELSASGLGGAPAYRCLLVRGLGSAAPAVEAAFTVPAPQTPVRRPVFRYGPKGENRLAGPGERQLIRVSLMAPTYHPADTSPATLETIRHLAETNAFEVYHYALPDGSVYAYHPPLRPQAVVETLQVGDFTVDLTYAFNETQKGAIRFAFQAWSDRLTAMMPIHLTLGFAALGGGTLAEASSSFVSDGQYAYPLTVYNHIQGEDAYPDDPDYGITFNSNYAFHYGTNDVCPSGYIDFATVLLHEVTHGLGFTDTLYSDGTYLLGLPSLWETCLYYNGSRLNTLTASQRAAALTSQALYWDGTAAKEANGGTRIQIYAPSTYAPGSTASHWDTGVTFTTFMKYAIGTGTQIRTINEREVGALEDVGWAVAPPPSDDPVTDDVEAHTAFAIDSAPPWSFLDADQSYTYGIEDVSFSNDTSRMAFIVFDPGQTSPPLTDPDWAAYSGSQYFACFASTAAPNDDWMVSPQLDFGRPVTFAFKAKSVTDTYGLERFRVGYSTNETFSTANFIPVTAAPYVQAPTSWTAYSYTMPSNTRYVALQCVSDDAFVFMVDDLYYGVPLTARGTPRYWLDQYGLVSGGDYEAADAADPDLDGFDNGWEYRLGLHPGASNTCALVIESVAAHADQFITTVLRTVTGATLPEGPYGSLLLHAADFPGDAFTPLEGTAVTGASAFDAAGRRTYTNQVQGAARFFRARLE